MTTQRKVNMAFAILVVVLFGFASYVDTHDNTSPSSHVTTTCAEDDACWDCATMGNRVCGFDNALSLFDDGDNTKRKVGAFSMATTYGHDGDTFIVGRYAFRVNDNGDGDVELLPVVEGDNVNKRDNARATVYINVRVPVHVSDADIAGAPADVRRDDDDEDNSGVVCYVARERIHRVLSGLSGYAAHALDIEEVVFNKCDACDKNLDGDEYTTGEHRMCATCVNRAIAFRVVQDVLANVGDHDVPLARAVAYLHDDDRRMSTSGVSHVDSLSSGYDMLRGLTRDQVWEHVRDVVSCVVDVVADPPA